MRRVKKQRKNRHYRLGTCRDLQCGTIRDHQQPRADALDEPRRRNRRAGGRPNSGDAGEDNPQRFPTAALGRVGGGHGALRLFHPQAGRLPAPVRSRDAGRGHYLPALGDVESFPALDGNRRACGRHDRFRSYSHPDALPPFRPRAAVLPREQVEVGQGLCLVNLCDPPPPAGVARSHSEDRGLPLKLSRARLQRALTLCRKE